jgi:hypothetical protein
VRSGEVAFEVNVRNDDRRVAQEVHIIVETAGLQPKAGDGSSAEYAVRGPFLQDDWVRQTALVSLDDLSLARRLGAITKCYVHAVDFEDGAHWEGPSPL